MDLRVGSVIDATEAEGPGLRFVLWVQGCSLACPDCCNPHMWSERGGELWTQDQLWGRLERARARHPELEGLTLVGGEPFEQAAGLAAFCARARAAGLNVMAFSGYTLAELAARPDAGALLAEVDLLVDGRYQRAEHTSERRFVGSTNQVMHFLTDAFSPEDPRFREPNHAEIRMNHLGEVQVVGFPFEKVRAAFDPAYQARLKKQAGKRLPAAGGGS